MKTFSSFGDFALQLAEVSFAEVIEERKALDAAARVIQKEAKRELGTYQEEIGPFVAWAELADSTKADRLRLGYTENDPGVRSGEMRDSIQYEVGDKVAFIGSNDEHMEFFELGTSKQPPRSVLAGSALRKSDEVRDILGRAVFLALTGRQVHEGMITLREQGDD